MEQHHQLFLKLSPVFCVFDHVWTLFHFCTPCNLAIVACKPAWLFPCACSFRTPYKPSSHPDISCSHASFFHFPSQCELSWALLSCCNTCEPEETFRHLVP